MVNDLSQVFHIIGTLEHAETGSAELDQKLGQLAYPDRNSVMIDHEACWEVGAGDNLRQMPMPKFSRTLDATLPWEEIVRVQRMATQPVFWRAWHTPMVTADGATETLARRTAALKAHFCCKEYLRIDDQPKAPMQRRSMSAEPSDELDQIAFRAGHSALDPEVIIEILVEHIGLLKSQSPDLVRSISKPEVPGPADEPRLFQEKAGNHSSNGACSDSGDLLSVVLNMQFNEMRPSKTFRARANCSVRRFIECHGDRPINSYSKQDIRSFLLDLMDMPKFVPQSMIKLPMPVILETIRGNPDTECITRRTIDIYRKDLHHLFAWALTRDLCDRNPAAGIKVIDRRTRSSMRTVYDESDLKHIFEESPLYRGCEAARLRKRPGNLIVRDSLFWLPLFALYTGARLAEMANAFPEDFKVEGGIDYFEIHEGHGKPHLKSESAARRVPIHPELLRLGILDYVEDRRETGWNKVFEEMQGRRNVERPDGWSQAWRQYQRGIGIVDRRKVFHSFRHTFKRACREAGIQEEIHDAITGHKFGGAGRRYGGELPLTVMAEAMDQVRYPGIDLSYLYQD